MMHEQESVGGEDGCALVAVCEGLGPGDADEKVDGLVFCAGSGLFGGQELFERAGVEG